MIVVAVFVVTVVSSKPSFLWDSNKTSSGSYSTLACVRACTVAAAAEARRRRRGGFYLQIKSKIDKSK